MTEFAKINAARREFADAGREFEFDVIESITFAVINIDCPNATVEMFDDSPLAAIIVTVALCSRELLATPSK